MRHRSTPDLTLRRATPADKRFVLSLQRRYTDQLGYLPAGAIDVHLARSGILLALERGQPAGYLLHQDRLSTHPCCRPILQAAVCYDATRRHIGSALVARAAQEAASAGRALLRLWCRSELEANAFWRAIGMTAVATRPAGKSRGGTVTLWTRQLLPLRPIDVLLARPERHRGPGGFFSSRPLELTPIR